MDPQQDAASRFESRYHLDPTANRASLLAEMKHQATIDLDGDATPDPIYAYTPGEVPTSLVYIVRGTCGHLVAAVEGDVRVLPTRTAGWADLAVERPGTATPARVATLRFDGVSYPSAPK